MRVLVSDLSQSGGCDSKSFIFSESYRPPPPGSLCGSWPQPPPCSRRGSCACPSSDGVHRRDSHSGSRTLTKQTSAHQNVYGEIASELWCVNTLAVLTCQADLLAAHEASVLLGFEGVGCFGLFTFSCVWRSGGRCGLSDNWKNSHTN